MKQRKTVEVKTFLDWGNNQLKRSDFTKEFKAGICSSIETVLHESGNYNGFYFLGDYPNVRSVDYYDRHYFYNQ